MTYGLLLLGLVLLVAGAEVLVKGASRLAAAAGLSPLVVGLTVVAFGTSSPELGVSVVASIEGDADIAVGNVVGSNIFNVLLILGLSAAVAPLVVSRRMLREQVPIMIGVSFLLLLLTLDLSVGRAEGGLLLAGIVAYTALFIRRDRAEFAAALRTSSGPAADGQTGSVGADDGAPAAATEGPIEHPAGRPKLLGGVVLTSLGLVLLVLGSRWLVHGARALALQVGLSELVVGLTVVAAGTSLPELATSVVAGLRGARDIAVGNIVGSNIFNILAILGVAALVAPSGLTTARAAVSVDIPIMIAAAVACLPVFLTGLRVSRGEGVLFVLAYVAYTVWLLTSRAGAGP